MNLQYVKYALEISRTGSISKAAENLSVAQPNLSRAVKELESQLGIAIFERTRTGMTVTPEGEKLLSAGERILRDVSELETMFDGETVARQGFSIACPPSAYLSHAFVTLCHTLPEDGRYDLTYREVAAADAFGMVERGECKLGILRHPIHFDRYYAEQAAKRGLALEAVAEFTPAVVAGLGSSLAGREQVYAADLTDLREVASPDAPRVDADGTSRDPDRRLTVLDRLTAYDLLNADHKTYLFSDPLPLPTVTRHGLIQRPSADATAYRDVLVYPKGYKLNSVEELFLKVLRETVKETLG